MDNIEIITLVKKGILIGVQLAGPILVSAMLIGLLISIFQATTQIQEPTLTFVPKLTIILLIVVLLSSWMLDKIGVFFLEIIKMISTIKGT